MIKAHLELKNLSYHFGPNNFKDQVLRSINLQLNHGELIGLIGPSGSGKTTFLRLISGFERPSSGQIYFEGNLISSSDFILPTERRGIGMVFQDYALFPHLTVIENACFGLNKKENKERVNWLLDLVGISELVNRYPHQLSGGQKQRLALVRALAPGTSLVLLDEPFSSLDVEVRQRLRNQLLNVLRSCSASGILVTHDPKEALGICDKVAVLKDGVLHQYAPPTEILTNPCTPFVGSFVSQNNLVKVDHAEGKYKTPFGSILVQSHLINVIPHTLMFDDSSVDLEPNNSGKAILNSKEFKGSHWVLNLSLENCNFNVIGALDFDYTLGQRFNISFITGKYGFLYPGGISCVLKSTL